jgi:acetyl esterase/lipase
MVGFPPGSPIVQKSDRDADAEMAQLNRIIALLLLVVASAAGVRAQIPGISPSTVIWSDGAGGESLADVYRPPGAARPLPALIDVHGGAWGSGDRTQGRVYAAALAKDRVVISIDFRQSPDFQHPAASADVVAAVRFVRLNAEALGVDPARIGLIGSSSGGHLALLAALRHDAPEHTGTPVRHPDGRFAAADTVDASVAFVVALWPVSDPEARYRYARRAGLTRLADLTRLYFPDERAMRDASIPRIVLSGDGIPPPALVVQPGDDTNIPQDMTLDLIRSWQARDGRLDYAFYPRQPHAFGHFVSAETSDLVTLIDSFMRRQGG